MTANNKFSPNRALLLTAFVTLAGSCFATTVACDSTTSLSGTNTNTTSGITIAAGGTPQANDFNTLSTTDTGCASGNIQFTNLAASTPAGTGGVTAPETTYISTLTNQTLGSSAPVFAVLSSIRGADNGAEGAAGDDVNNWFDASGFNASSTTINNRYEFSSTGPTVSYFNFALEGVTLGAAGTTGGTGVAGTVTGNVYLCLGGNFTGTTSGTCSTSNVQTIAITAGTTNYSLALTTAEANVGVLNNIVINGATRFGGTTWVTAYEDEFATPEPSTFALLGAALAGLAALRFRKTTARKSS
ncbi:MAG TPA: PEP-CTERM sorting domain-containing protein [Bryobacteraceae bacterium]|jgi:hypothetical protein|nr:PEP-CTERM sorting domain-containing protein [Bryobacteraceae bacterium]